MAKHPALKKIAQRHEGVAPAKGPSLATPSKSVGPAGSHWQPGTPGVATPPVAPFHSGGQMIQHANDIAAIDQQLASLDFNLENQRINTEYQKSGIDKQLKSDTANENDTAAYRGLFHSSIRDGDLSDLNATATIRKDLLQKTLDAAELNASRVKSMLNGAGGQREQIETGYNQQGVENAGAVGASQPQWQTPPTAGSFQPNAGLVPGQQPGQQPWEADPYFHQLNPLEQYSYAVYWKQNHPNGETTSPTNFMRSDMWQSARQSGWQG